MEGGQSRLRCSASVGAHWISETGAKKECKMPHCEVVLDYMSKLKYFETLE